MKEQLDITAKIHRDILEWYQSAERKAQMILTVLGSFIVFSSGLILANPENLQKTLNMFDARIFVCLALTFISMIYGIFSALMCLLSRVSVDKPSGDKEIATYPEMEMYFFKYHVHHKPAILTNSLKDLNEEKQIKMYSFQIIKLSENVSTKHRFVNQGFLAVGLSVFFLLLTTAFYLAKLT